MIVTYWMSYPANNTIGPDWDWLPGPNFLHDGDWKYVALQFDADGNVVAIVTSAHGRATYHPVPPAQLVDG